MSTNIGILYNILIENDTKMSRRLEYVTVYENISFNG